MFPAEEPVEEEVPASEKGGDATIGGEEDE
jgi:hypothetical protein